MPVSTIAPRTAERRRYSILSRLLFPIMAIMLMQSLLYVVLLWQGGVVKHADENAYAILYERVENRRQYIENEMRLKWSNLSESEFSLLADVRAVLEASGRDIADIAADAELNSRIVDAMVPDLIYLLRKNTVTGAFVVLNGPGLQSDLDGTSRAGFYLRDLDPASYSLSNTDLMVERGMPAISKRMRLTLDAQWSPAFHLTGADPAREAFFTAPIGAALKSESRESADFGYWSNLFSLTDGDIRVITYSIPLIYDDGTVFGVLGIDITESYLNSLLAYDELLPGKAGAYFLGTSRDGGITYERVTISGPAYRLLMGAAPELTLENAESSHTFTLSGTERAHAVLGCVSPIDLYTMHAPFYGDQWALIGVVDRADLLSFSDYITRLSYFATATALVMAMVCVFLSSRMVTQPISALVTDMQKTDPNRPIQLKKLGIKEIDELTDSIEGLSASVAESASKISKILSLTKSSIGVYEFKDDDEYVFCSTNLYTVLNWPIDAVHAGDQYMPRALFDERRAALQERLVDAREHIYMLSSEAGGARWVQLTEMHEGQTTLGAVSDVTRDMLTKQQIEYERDYDLLTNLFNRRAFNQKLSGLFTSGQSLGYAALIMWDLDDLKYVNDTYGHECGDEYIIALSECLKYFAVNFGALCARRSGDEFYTFLYGFTSQETLRAAIDQGWANLKQQPFLLPGGLNYHIRVSGGIAWYPGDAVTWQELLRYADYAMYDAKHTIKGSLNEFRKASYLNDASMLYGMEALNKLIDYALIKYAFQPIWDVANGAVYGYELLMRPQVNEFRTPADVLRIAQAQAKLYYIERITWFGAMSAFVERLERGKIGAGQHLFINSIGNQLLSDDDLKRFRQTYAPYLDRLVIEITEGERTDNALVERKLDLAGEWNAMVAIDNYGTGANAESALSFLSAQLVKLDMSVVRSIDLDISRQNLLKSLIAFIRSRGAKIIATGVETEAEMRVLVQAGVDYLQGHYLAHPEFEIPPIPPTISAAITQAYQEARGGEV